MQPFELHQPKTTAEAVDLLARYGNRASLLAGGTDLLVEIKEAIRTPEIVVDAKLIPGLARLEATPARGLSIGALVTAREVEVSPTVEIHYRGLWQASRELGSIQVRNRATIVGNVCRASPSADTIPPLIADGAVVRLVGPRGAREMPLEDFFSGPGKTVLASGEIVLGIDVPAPPANTGKCYIKHGRRKAMELATVGVAVTLTLEGATCKAVRIALGAVAPTVIRATDAESILTGKSLDAATIDRAAQAAAARSSPISNVRGSADYRRRMVGELTVRAISSAMEAAR